MNLTSLRTIAIGVTITLGVAFGATAIHAEERPLVTQEQMQERVEDCTRHASTTFGPLDDATPDSPAATAALAALTSELNSSWSSSSATQQMAELKYADAQVTPPGTGLAGGWILRCVVATAMKLTTEGWPAKDKIVKFLAELASTCLFGEKVEWVIKAVTDLIARFKGIFVLALAPVAPEAADLLASAPVTTSPLPGLRARSRG